MRRALLACFLTVFIIVLCGCSLVSFDTGVNMVAPKTGTVPLEGKWKVVKCLKKEKNTLVPFKDTQWTGRVAQFSVNAAMLGNDFWIEPGYKVKRVNAEEYFLFSFGVPYEKLNIKEKEINVITLTNEDKFLYEIIKITDDSVIILMEDRLLFLDKISDKTDKGFSEEALERSSAKAVNGTTAAKARDYKSGIILGIRSQKQPEGENGTAALPEYSYKSLWIAADNKILHPVLKTDDILLPRMNGFWKLSTKRISDGLRDENVFHANRFPQTAPAKPDLAAHGINLWGSSTARIYNAIDYIGNDYVSVESIEKARPGNSAGYGDGSRLWLIPVDSIASPKGVKISDIAGKAGVSALYGAKENMIRDSGLKPAKAVDTGIENENFGITRKTGHWIFKGRYSYILGGKLMYSDFKINLIPPSSIVYYDTLCLPWTSIKDRVPGAIDAFTSPMEDIAVIRTSQKLYIFAINNGVLNNSPLRRIALGEGDTIIMAEWAGGKYVQNWESVFKADKAVEVR